MVVREPGKPEKMSIFRTSEKLENLGKIVEKHINQGKVKESFFF